MRIDQQLLQRRRRGPPQLHRPTWLQGRQGAGVGGGQAAGEPQLQQRQGALEGGHGGGLQLHGLARRQHLPQVPQQPEAGDIRAGQAPVLRQ